MALKGAGKAAFIFAAVFVLQAALLAEDNPCKSKSGEVKVVYPELAKRMKISGTVRIQVQLTATGSVRESKILGGNPVLAGAAQDAVKQTKFEGTDACVVVFQFKE